MRTREHDYGKTNGLWWARHGEMRWDPDRYGRRIIVTINGYEIPQSEALGVIAGLLQAERRDWDLWRMGDPKLPEPLSSLLLELPVWPVERTMAEIRKRDADWDVNNAAKHASRRGRTG